ncbi:MAG: 16S rRNA (guanine(966)-N(2))-methyltransferase RsmD [Omnitrophica WOR_2 bacterium RIFOXYB2_FULL_38_16]|nr:MAG: 16S rRNA (guanine(966)-N(2))-methyltransferase RsmD [Omnitrophica WOR_2 bacterium RIFOXYB2_FULL_38_16]OGX59430.1 MAG: 16S rRNA (guanine(966)-N(2))-methyltransferase RsmD [Omnitrophica WOR_2 bacterium RIFOXYC2_FULL_38_12]
MPAGIRPTQNIARKAVFDIIGHDMEGLTFLELFAGSGAIGMEALSSGAKEVFFIEKDQRCFEILSENLSLVTGLSAASEDAPFKLVNADAFVAVKMLARREKKFDIVFADPPYVDGLAKKALKTIEAYDILHPKCTVIIQHQKDEILPKIQGRFFLFKQKQYGKNFISIYNIKNNE